MGLDTASVQQPGLNLDFNPTAQQERVINGPSGIGQIGKSVADVLQRRQDEVKESYDKMNSDLENVDARDQVEFLKIIEDKRNELKGLAKNGVNNLDYIASKSKILNEIAAKKKQSETFSTELAGAYKEMSANPYIKTDELRNRLGQLSNTPLSKRKGNEIQALLSDPNVYNADMIAYDAIKKTIGPDISESYAVKRGNDVYKGVVKHSPLIRIQKNSDGSPVIGRDGKVQFEYDITDDKVSAILANSKMPGILKSYVDLAAPDKNLQNAGAGEVTLGQSFSNRFKSLIAQIAGEPSDTSDIKLGSTSGSTTAVKNQEQDANIAAIADAIKSKNSGKLASNIGAQKVVFVSDGDNKYLVPDFLNKGNFKLADKGKPEQKFKGIFIIGKDGKTYGRDFDPTAPGTLAAKLYEENKADLVAGEKENTPAPKNQSLAERMKALKNK